MAGLVVRFPWFSVSSFGYCLVLHITSFVSENFSYTHIPSSSCGIIQPWLCDFVDNIYPVGF